MSAAVRYLNCRKNRASSALECAGGGPINGGIPGPGCRIPGNPVLKPTLRTRLQEKPAVWAALCGLVLLARYPAWIMRPRLWAEDGNVFFLQAGRSWLADVLTPYAGYLHLLPRTVAWAGVRLDPALIPSFYVYSALLIALCVVARLFSARLHLPCKPLLALAIVTVPGTGEVFLTPTNLQWITALSLVMTLLMDDPRSALEWAGDLVFLAAAGLTGPFGIFVAPFFIYRALSRRTRASIVVASVIVATAIAQVWVLRAHPGPNLYPGGLFDPVEFVAVLSSHIPLAFADAQAWVYRADRTVVIGLGLVGFALISCALFVRDEFQGKRLQLILFAAVLVGFTTLKVRFDIWDYRETLNADRYLYIPRVIVLWVAVSCLHGRPQSTRILASLAAAVLLVATALTPYLEGPAYTLRHDERPYYDWSPYVEGLRRGARVEVTTSPGWTFVVPERKAPR
jgi:hypothetical protein